MKLRYLFDIDWPSIFWWIGILLMVVLGLAVVVAFGVALVSLIREIEQVGLKAIFEKLWEGTGGQP